jgi:hypothetical protein
LKKKLSDQINKYKIKIKNQPEKTIPNMVSKFKKRKENNYSTLK